MGAAQVYKKGFISLLLSLLLGLLLLLPINSGWAGDQWSMRHACQTASGNVKTLPSMMHKRDTCSAQCLTQCCSSVHFSAALSPVSIVLSPTQMIKNDHLTHKVRAGFYQLRAPPPKSQWI